MPLTSVVNPIDEAIEREAAVVADMILAKNWIAEQEARMHVDGRLTLIAENHSGT